VGSLLAHRHNDAARKSESYGEIFTTVSSVTPVAATGGVENAVKAPVEELILKAATVLALASAVYKLARGIDRNVARV
jgi:hypothetical protein